MGIFYSKREEELENEVIDLEQQNISLRGDISNLTKELETYKSSYESEKTISEAFKSQKEKLIQENSDYKSKLANLEQDLAHAIAQNNTQNNATDNTSNGNVSNNIDNADNAISLAQLEVFERNLKMKDDMLKEKEDVIKVQNDVIKGLNAQMGLLQEQINEKISVAQVEDNPTEVVAKAESESVPEPASVPEPVVARHTYRDGEILYYRGAMISNIFKKSTKFGKYCVENNLEYMDDLVDFDWDKVQSIYKRKSDFEKVKAKVQEYFDENRLS